MKQFNVNYYTGVCGTLFFLLNLINIPLYFVYNGAPPLWNIEVRTLLELFSNLSLVFFVTGIRSIIINAKPDYELPAMLILITGVSYALLLFVADALQIGSVWSNTIPTDPTLAQSNGVGAILIYGPIARLLSALFLILSGRVLAAAQIIPAWIKWLAYIISVIQIAFVPTIFKMTSPVDFYSVNGWNIPVLGSIFICWVLMLSIVLLRVKRTQPANSI